MEGGEGIYIVIKSVLSGCSMMHNVLVETVLHICRARDVLQFEDFIIFCALGSASDNDIEMHAPLGSVLLTLEFAVTLISEA